MYVLQNPNCTFFYVDNIVHGSNADWLRLGLGQRRAQERSAGMEEVQKTKQSNVGNLKKNKIKRSTVGKVQTVAKLITFHWFLTLFYFASYNFTLFCSWLMVREEYGKGQDGLNI